MSRYWDEGKRRMTYVSFLLVAEAGVVDEAVLDVVLLARGD